MAKKSTDGDTDGVTKRSPSLQSWRDARGPNYRTNTDLRFPYSEYPRTFGRGWEYESYRVTPEETANRIADFWGEGRIVTDGITTGFPNAYNINHQYQLVSNGPDRGRMIPNRVPTEDWKSVSVSKYIPDGSFNTVTLMGAPIIRDTANEIARIVSAETRSSVVIFGFDAGDDDVNRLLAALDSKSMVINAAYVLSSELKRVTLSPPLAFSPATDVVREATRLFGTGSAPNMKKCATILTALWSTKAIQPSAGAALSQFFEQTSVKNNPYIFALGYALEKSADGQSVMDTFMHQNVVRIVRKNYNGVRITSRAGANAYLSVNHQVKSGSWQWAQFATRKYLDSDKTYDNGWDFVLNPVSGGQRFQIKSHAGVTAYLSVNHQVKNDSWQWAQFATLKYLQSDDTYAGGWDFWLVPINGGERFQIQSHAGALAYLSVNHQVKKDSWQWAQFATLKYLKDDKTYARGWDFGLEFI